jgi:predicted DNA-binding helix-hairpin-helix protein
MLIIPWNDWLVAKKLRLEHNFNGYIHLKKVFQALAMN